MKAAHGFAGLTLIAGVSLFAFSADEKPRGPGGGKDWRKTQAAIGSSRATPSATAGVIIRSSYVSASNRAEKPLDEHWRESGGR